MCGIVGIYRYKTNRRVERSELEIMMATMPYRGPDGSGVEIDGCLGFGHLRLSIIDTHDRSAQPMADENGRYWLTYNGEVYNYVELKQRLHEQGIHFRTESDTEVILAAMIHDEEWALEAFNGMYAFGFYDRCQKRLQLVRDRMGIKPLYYIETDEGLVFASELKALLTVAEVKVRFDPSLLDGFMSVGYCPGQQTLLAPIQKLSPGHRLLVQNDTCSTHQYWDVSYQDQKDEGEAYYCEELDQLFKSAVQWQLRSDVPLGVFLSGGVDSSAVVEMMHRLGVPDIKTFSVRWDFGQGFDESQYARQIAAQFKTDHHEHTMTPQNFVDFLPSYIEIMDEPVTEAAAISLFHIAKAAKEKVTVVLSGEGADEVFGGYPIYKYMQHVHTFRKLPKPLQAIVMKSMSLAGGKFRKWADLASRPLDQSYFGVSVYDQLIKERLYTDETKHLIHDSRVAAMFAPFYENVTDQSVQRQMQYVDYKTWLLDDLLIKADRMSMAASLELRVPFLDHRFVEFAARLPQQYRLKNGEPKYLLKKTLERYLPPEVLYRKKMGFPTPLAQLFQGPLAELVNDVVLSSESMNRGLFKAAQLKQLVDEHHSKRVDHHKVLWQLVVLELWQQRFRPNG